MTVVLYTFARIWLVVYATARTDQLAGLTMPKMLWYLVITEAILLSAPRAWAEVDQDVRTGRLAVQLIYPVSYVLAHFGRSIGERIVRFTINLVAGAVIALALAGPIPVSASGFLMFLAVLPASFILDFLANFLVGLCAFWLESTAGVALIYSRLVMLLGGTFLPIEIYPIALQPVVRALPFASMIYAPGRMFVDPNVSLLRGSLFVQTFALAVLACIVMAVQSIALRRLFANGG